MRVIAGSARRLPLKSVPGLDTRPTTDRIKETLFNIIQNELYGCSFLDLFSGSGAIAIEALSRGAASAVLVENNRQALACIRQNLSFTRLEAGARVFSSDVFMALRSLEGQPAFDVIFMDPPYHMGLEHKVLEMLSESSLADENTLLIVEAALKTSFDEVPSLGYEVKRIKQYKTNMHVFLQKKPFAGKLSASKEGAQG